MTIKELVLLSWSGGKDCAFTLHKTLKSNKYNITLLTTLTEEYKRISMHGIREELLEAQADSTGLPLEKVWIPADCSNELYGSIMEKVLMKYFSQGCRKVIFGDLFLEDIRKFREEKLLSAGMTGEFPLWKRNTALLSEKFIREGYKAITTCIDSQLLDNRFIGRNYDKEFLADLPHTVDPCGENGEFHTFVYEGPIFRKPIPFKKGEIVFKSNRYYFCDLLP